MNTHSWLSAQPPTKIDFDHPHVHDDRLRRHVLYRLAAARSRP